MVAGALIQQIAVTYSDNVAVEFDSLGHADLSVERLDGTGTTFPCSLQWVSQGDDADAIEALYWMDAPGGDWDAGDNGSYEISLRRDQVVDVNGLQAEPGILGAFDVQIIGTGQFLVDSLFDAPDAVPGDDQSDDGFGHSTLRAAVMEANAKAGENTVVLPAGTYTLDVAGTGEDAAATGDLDVTDHLSILGAGARVTVIDAGAIDRVLHVLDGVSLHLSGLTITGGSADNFGGGLFNAGGDVTITQCIVSGNTAVVRGGGIDNADLGTLSLAASTVADNTAEGDSSSSGGGISNRSASQLTILSSTVSGNVANGTFAIGGGILNDAASLSLTASTITDNYAQSDGGGVVHNAGSVHAGNTIVAANTAGGSNPDVRGAFQSDGFNLIGNVGQATGFTHGVLGDLVGSPGAAIDAMLGPLGDNRGPTDTHALAYGSPAIDAGSAVSAGATDQRGIDRPQDGDADGVYLPDVGAVERYFGEIHGLKFHDRNGDGSQDPDEPGLSGWTIYLDLNENGHLDVDEPSTLTGADGHYAFTLLDPSITYVVAEVPQEGWEQTYPTDLPRQFTVDSFADVADANPGDGVADDGSGHVTLRAAVMEANALPGKTDIVLASGTYTLTLACADESWAATGDLDVRGEVTILGAGADLTIIDAAGLDRVFDVLPGGQLRLEGVTATGGSTPDLVDGGGVLNWGQVSIVDAAVAGNAAGGSGGGIFNTGTLEITRSLISNNTAGPASPNESLIAFGAVVGWAKDVATDAAGNVYVTGSFKGNCDFDPSAGVTQLTSVAERDVFVAKYSQAGELTWVRQLNGPLNEYGRKLGVGPDGTFGLRASSTRRSTSIPALEHTK